jgi:hypothetical protein
MAYNRKNKLLQMQHVCEVYQKHMLPGVTTAWVYRNIIFPQFHISIATLYIYLGTSIKKELRQIEDSSRPQLSLFE